jgi:hypothetical protein
LFYLVDHSEQNITVKNAQRLVEMSHVDVIRSDFC